MEVLKKWTNNDYCLILKKILVQVYSAPKFCTSVLGWSLLYLTNSRGALLYMRGQIWIHEVHSEFRSIWFCWFYPSSSGNWSLGLTSNIEVSANAIKVSGSRCFHVTSPKPVAWWRLDGISLLAPTGVFYYCRPRRIKVDGHWGLILFTEYYPVQTHTEKVIFSHLKSSSA